MNRIDNLESGQIYQLRFNGAEETEPAIFLDIMGEGDRRLAWFEQNDPRTGEPYQWSAYRYQGRWVYGTSAQRLQVVTS